MASDAGRGIQGDRRQGADAAHAGRGMGRGAGRNAGRGNGRGGDKNKYSWKRSEGDGDGDCSASSNPTSAAADKTRWEAAATTRRQDGGIWVEKQQSTAASGDTGSGQTSSPARRPHGKQNINQVPPTKNPSSCIICKSNDHTPASRPQVFCERCNKLGHLASVCTAFAPWECIAPMCAFQSKGQGFYYIHDSCIASQLKERSNNIVVKIVEGETSTRQMELDLSDYPATGWRCSAHAIGPGVFVVRFPNPRAVAQICYVGKVTLKTSGAVIHATQWSSAVGSKGVMEVAWVRVINIPLDKRSERNVAFVASLVGIPLEIDKATLHRPASVRVKIGCRNVDTMPGIAESILGGHFYDFNYEVEQVLIRDPNRDRNEIRMPTSDDGGKNEKNSHTSNPGLQMGNASSGLGGKSSPIPQHVVPDPLRESQESVESDDSLHTSLLIDTLKYEHEQKLKEKVSTLTQQTRIKKKIEYKETVKSYSDVVKSLPRVVEVVGHHDSALKVVNEYRVESPENTEVIPTPPLISEENLRFSLRNVQSKMEHVEDKAAAVTKKRNMEGLMAGEDRESMERGAKMLRSNASTMMRICAPPSVTK